MLLLDKAVNIQLPALLKKKDASDSHQATIEIPAATNTGFALNPLSSANSSSRHDQVDAEALSPTSSSSSRGFNIIDEDIDFPEGGLRAYLTVFGSFMGLIPAFGMINSVGAIEAYVSTHQLANVSTSTVSWIFSIYTFIAFSSCIFSGTFFDRRGAFRPMLIGSIAFCAGIFATANAETVYQFILGFGVVVGFGTGMLISPLIGSVSHYFNKKRAAATSVATIGGSLGGIIMPLMLRNLYDTTGFQWALRITGFFCMACLIISLTFTKERLHPETEKIDSFQKMLKVYVIDVFDYKSLKDFKFMSCSFAIALTECSLVVVLVYFPSYAIMRGQSDHTAYMLIITSNASAIAGRFLPSIIADRIGRFNVAIGTITICAIVSLVVWLPFGQHLAALYTFAVMYGFFSGSILSLSPVCCGQISRTEEFGRRYATMYLIVALTMLGLIPVAGAIIGDGSVKGYDNFIGYSVALLGAGIACYVVCRHLCVGFRWCKF
ncbi:CYFA0S14e01464g1_1 [Cyberlindnera fabianii]|uniref:CYFA0S14e01464g1_1 n=1 Tax=Cyberlindnera fabianii TaxID=36022 RepID=A0A061B371_CYBFA|nr:putative transporter MCH4 [Cyberlindnera fabianii]CDR44264.1 CYFA0S14e01464g1_1 [Cyberlindnera fabianii]